MAALDGPKPISDQDYRILLMTINKALSDRDLHTLKFLCRDKSLDLQRGRLDDCKIVSSVFDMLEKKLCLTREEPGLLVALLDIMKQDGLKRKVEEKCGTVKVKKTILAYRRMVVTCAGLINDIELNEQLKPSLGSILTDNIKAELKYPIQLMHALEKKHIIGPDDVSYLTNMAKMLDNEDMIDLVRTYLQEIVIEHYKMDSEQRGLCIIINNIDFSKSNNVTLECRTGSEKDKDKLKETFRKLEFTVREEKNLTAEKMIAAVKEASEEGHSEHDCFVCCIMSHGNFGTVSGIDGKQVKIMDIAKYVRSSECPSLAYKPKLFFIESCQGESYDEKYDPKNIEYLMNISTQDDANVNSMATGGGDGDPREMEEGSIPDDSDFLFAYACSPGRKAKLTTSGSIYIKKLTEVLNKHYKDFDLLSMLTLVTREVCKENFEDPASNRPGTTYGQAPVHQSNLRKKLYFS